ncbi:unnamed protein product [Calypogeia fissa]
MRQVVASKNVRLYGNGIFSQILLVVIICSWVRVVDGFQPTGEYAYAKYNKVTGLGKESIIFSKRMEVPKRSS